MLYRFLIASILAIPAMAKPVRVGSAISERQAYQGRDGQPHGFFFDVYSRAAQKLGHELTWVFRSDRMDDVLQSGDVDLYAAAFPSPERLERFHLTESWWPEDVYLIHRADSGVRSLADLKGRTVSMSTRPVMPIPVTSALPGAHVVQEPDWQQRLEAVCHGRSAATVLIHSLAVTARGQSPAGCPGVELRLLPLQQLRLGLSIVARKENGDLAESFRKAIGEMANSGELAELAQRHNMYPLDSDYLSVPQQPRNAAWVAATVLVAAFAGWLGWMRLRRRVPQPAAEQNPQSPANARDLFLATVSHEIRTPLNATLGFADLLQETPLTVEQSRLLRDLRTATVSLLSMLSGIMEFSRLRSGHAPVIEPADLPELIEEVITTFSLEAEGKHLDFVVWLEPGLPNRILSSPRSIKQVVSNLLSNALKFTSEGCIRLNIGAENGGKTLRIEVSDSGIGIPLEARARIFEPYEQIDLSDRRAYRGIGLGLAVVKELTTALRGEISIESTEAIGTRFTVDLPLNPVPGSASWISTLRPPDTPRVQIISGGGANLLILREYLQAAGYDVEPLADLDTVRSRSTGGSPADYVLLETAVAAPEEGFPQRIRSEIPAVRRCLLVGSISSYRMLPAAVREGFDGFLTLPVTISSLRSIAGALQEAPEQRTPETPIRGRVLVIDDNAINRKIACALLATMGVSVETATNGIEGLEKCRRSFFDVVLMDCQMPEMDGFECSLNIRALAPRGKEFRIVGTSASTDADTERRCLEAGMDAYLPKPISRATLWKGIVPHINGSAVTS